MKRKRVETSGPSRSLKESDAKQPIGQRDCLAIAALVDVRDRYGKDDDVI